MRLPLTSELVPVRRPPVGLLVLVAACTATASDGLDPAPTITALTVLPAAPAALPTWDSLDFVAVASYDDGSQDTIPVAWNATGGTITAGGRYRAGGVAGLYRVIGGIGAPPLADTVAVTVADTAAPPSVVGVTITPGSANLQPGAVQAFTATAHWSTGGTTALAATWSATGGTITQGGSYTAGPTGGTFRVIGSGSGHADTAVVVIADTTTPVTVTSVTVAPDSVFLQPGAGQAFSATAHWSDGHTSALSAAWSATGGSITQGGLYTAGPTGGVYRVIASGSGHADTSIVAIADTTTPPVGGTVLFSEGFDDASIAGRGWYDNTTPAIAASGTHAGAGALQMAFTQGSATAVQGGSLRHKFTGTDRVYLRYWVKYSSNWVGSGVSYHPHEFHFTTNADGDWIGPSATHLTTYVEHSFTGGGGRPRLSLQDALNIDAAHVNQDLTNVTEARAAQGCNGNSDGYATGCYQSGGQWRNEKIFTAAQPSWTAATQNSWHKVEVYFQMNTISGGKGQYDGIARYWYDGNLVLDYSNVLFRTAAQPGLLFTQFIIAPYIGVGSPVAQTMWVDDVTVATGPVP